MARATPASGGLHFPADFGAHPATRTEWWYLTGSLAVDNSLWGFQVTFFRSAPRLAPGHPSRFAAHQLLFAHTALTDVAARRQRHDQRIARAGFGLAGAAVQDTGVRLRDWSLQRRGPVAKSVYHAMLRSGRAGFSLDLNLAATQPVLVQGESGVSVKGPGASSHYYSEPQLTAEGLLGLAGRPVKKVGGKAWLDHEWSDTLLTTDTVGWDWIGMNLDDGGALTAFRLRRTDGSVVHAGGSFRTANGALRNFGPEEIRFTARRTWTSPASKASYPVAWSVETPVGRFKVEALVDAQELDSRASTGAFYWEGLSDLLDEAGTRLGRGYLEMTGYAGRLVI